MKINKLRFFSVMLFSILFLDAVFLSFFRIGNVSVSTLQIPTIITSIVLGPIYGVLMGIVFGLISLFTVVSRAPSDIDLLFQNPLISILPRMCIGMVAGYSYRLFSKLFKKKLRILSVMLSAILGSFTNTVLVLYALYLTNRNHLISLLELKDKKDLQTAFIKIAGTNGLIEGLSSMFVVTIVVILVFRHFEKRGKNS